MRPIFHTYLLTAALFACFSTGSFAQVLDNASLNLNAGGYVNDVIFDEYHDCYIVVGNFTTINGVTRKNIAFLDRSTLNVLTAAFAIPVTAMDGEIRAVAITKTIVPMVNQTFHLYLGGNFSYITNSSGTYTRNGIIKMTSSQALILPVPPLPTFTGSSWNADLDMTALLTGYGSEGVDDILITNDTVIFSGKFMAVNDLSSYDLRDGIAAYTVSGTLLNYPSLASSGTYITSRFFTIEKKGANLYAGGYVNGGSSYNGILFKLNSAGAIMPSFNFSTSALRCVYDVEFFEDSLMIVAEDRNAQNSEPDQIRTIRQSNGTEKTNHTLSVQSGENIGGIGSGKSSLAVYTNYVYTTSGQAGYSAYSYESVPGAGPVAAPNWNANATNYLAISQNGKIHVARNKVFISASNLSTLSGQSRTGLGAYCLQPHRAENFTVFDTTICPEDSVIYTIPVVTYADGYKWEFTGNGAFIGTTSFVAPIEIEFPGANSLQLKFHSNFTPGQLKVTPYSNCSNGASKVYGNTITLNIHSNPLPHVNAGLDTTLTCVRDSVILYGYSDSAVVSYEWVYPFPQPTVIGQYDTVTTAGNYIFKVKNALGCPNFDTVNVSLDTLKPVVTLPLGTYDLTCAQPEKTFTGSSPTLNTTLEWFEPIDSVFLADPITVDLPGAYYLIVTDTVNGCQKTEGILVYNNFIIPDIAISGYPVLTSATELDTLTCAVDTLSLTSYSPTPLSTCEWISADTTAFYGTTLDITEGGFYYLYATESSTGCTNSMGIFILEYQNSLDAQTIANAELNCSVDSLVLNGTSLSAGATKQWTGTLISPSANPLTVYDPGTYYFTTTDALTGCTGIDSVIVIRTNDIELFAGNDTLVCNGTSIPLDVSYEGTIGGINYLWSNGSTTTAANYMAGTQNYAAVQIFGDNSCYGADTVFMNLPPVPVVQFEGFKPCDDGPSGSIVATPLSGLEPFSYSIDNAVSFQSSPVFGNLYVGTYPIVVRDSVQCLYPFTAVIDENSSLPTPQFLFSTYNFESDTVALVNVSNPPADSISWIFPPSLTVLNIDPLNPLLTLPDTGVFIITMQAYYGSCLVELSKPLYASPFDSLAATAYNLNGIKSIELYPNPTTGDFTVSVEFYRSQRASLVVQDMLGTTYVFKDFDETLNFTEPVSLDLSAVDGTYVLRIISEFDSATISFILAR